MQKSKRGRKPKIKLLENNNNTSNNSSNNNTNNTNNNITNVDISNVSVAKKRGRKPKGGKIINNLPEKKLILTVPNIILHLKCNINQVKEVFNLDYQYTPNVESIENYDKQDSNIFSSYYCKLDNENINKTIDKINIDKININNQLNIGNINTNIDSINTNIDSINTYEDVNLIKTHKNNNIKQDNNCSKIIINKNISEKLVELSNKFHNNICDNNSACFWCTYNFITQNIYIPKNIIDDIIEVYGCFCSPECAAAYLINESIDNSTKFERYALLNNLYSKIYNYDINIKCAPNPNYLLERFCGNLTIEEYRNLYCYNNNVIISNKPLSRLFPEIFEDNTSLLDSNNNKYNIKKFI